MLKYLLATTAFAICFVCAARAQDPQIVAPPAASADVQAVPLPAVEEMTCDQMTAEMIVAGQRMNSQMDPEFAREAMAMQQEAQQRQGSIAGSVAGGIGMGIACSIPGVGMACMAAQQAQMANAQRDAERNQQRMDAQMDRLNTSMEGIDQDRMMALSSRYEQMHCQAPQQ
jgi:hypothetical protein